MEAKAKTAMVCLRGESLTHRINQMKLYNAITAAAVAGISLFIPSRTLADSLPEVGSGPSAMTCYFSHETVANDPESLRPVDCLVERYVENETKMWFVKTKDGVGIRFNLIADHEAEIYYARAWIKPEDGSPERLVQMEWGVDDDGDLFLYSDNLWVKEGVPFSMFINTGLDLDNNSSESATQVDDIDKYSEVEIS
jgi:hypothetical protein